MSEKEKLKSTALIGDRASSDIDFQERSGESVESCQEGSNLDVDVRSMKKHKLVKLQTSNLAEKKRRGEERTGEPTNKGSVTENEVLKSWVLGVW